MIDGGKLYDWLEARGIFVFEYDMHEGFGPEVSRRGFEELFRQYVAELTGD